MDFKPFKTIIVARHGPREPITKYPKLLKFNKRDNDKENHDAKLTKLGIKHCVKFGKVIKNVYNKSIQNKNRIKLMSSNYNRTIDSLKYFMIGFDHNIDVKTDDIVIDNRLDYRLMDIDKPKELVNCNMELNEEILNGFGIKIDNDFDYFELYATLCVYKFHNVKINDHMTLTLYYQIKKVATEYCNKALRKENLSQNIWNLIKEQINDKNTDFVYLSTHDLILTSLILRFTNDKIQLPEFSSSVIFEVYSGKIKIYYDYQHIKTINSV